MSELPDLSGRVALVTGASRGIGYAVSVALAKAGAHVIAVARTVGGLEELDDAIQAAGGQATLVPFDLKDTDAIDRLGAAIFERWKRLDILFANAGMLGPLTPVGHIKPKQWDELVAINLTANWRLIRALDPLLRASDAGRAVFMTSGATYSPRAYWGGYAVTKMALEQLALTYAMETANYPLKVNLVNPGPIRTAMRAQAMPGEDPDTLKTPADIAPKILALFAPDFERHGMIYDFPQDGFLERPRPTSAE
ncbi:MAG: SDR family NAD(P)-dependent oxidoreductase [Rhodobiaceae bacterium]|nr:SDR family NAD(P)-dependent oxidoreductase [Rhodobiaceae bacterium]MCC0013445.1 SDR family NAD(P)-dependent oxidoreductase [Rhodobiaceae bacterium]MCC0018256.1 SDR family NAD(P)-dependent oxidoreductase [Rhodobiaceae bacterium]MCC0050853.1 SDR family NAD(P)-dependent oxidoreductase [Rhodobiaceae bacterium]MCC0060502.1 SDR family NAD(P)-dependent oxidoreductase [Rhodobiaceae bacterium]